jgi:hypothetical protein
MTEQSANEITHEEAEEELREELEWPQYFVFGGDVDIEGFVPAYYRVEGPNGPVSYCNPRSGPHPTTMYDLAMGAKTAEAGSFRQVSRDETPWPEDSDD